MGEALPVPSERSNAVFPLITAFDPWRTSVKIVSNAWSMESVSMNVPATIATPSTIAIAVRAVRSFRPSNPLSANLTTPLDRTHADRVAEGTTDRAREASRRRCARERRCRP